MILFITYGGGHVALVAPIIKELIYQEVDLVVLALTTAGNYFKEQGIDFIGYKDMIEASDITVQNWGKLLAIDVPSNGTISIEETIAYLGLNFRELVVKYGEQQAIDLYANYGRQAFLPVEFMKNFLSKIKPDLLIATNSPRSERAAIMAARELNIPSMCLVDLFALQEVQWIGQDGYADKICVLNESVRQMFIKHGRQPHETVVTGNPAFDMLNTQETKLAGLKLKQSRGWDDGKINILWASQPEPAKHPFNDKVGDPTLPRRIEHELRSFVAKHDGFRLIVRYHPSETELFMPQERVEFSPVNEKVAVVLNAVDVVIVTASTVGLEASIAGRKVISIDTSIFTEDAPYSTMGISTGVEDLDALSLVILKASKSIRALPEREQLPNATNLILSQIHSILNKNKDLHGSYSCTK